MTNSIDISVNSLPARTHTTGIDRHTGLYTAFSLSSTGDKRCNSRQFENISDNLFNQKKYRNKTMIKNSTETVTPVSVSVIRSAAIALLAALASATAMYFAGRPPVAISANVCLPETSGGLRIAPKADLEVSNGCARLAIANSGSAGLISTYAYCNTARGPKNWVPQQVEQELERNCAGR